MCVLCHVSTGAIHLVVAQDKRCNFFPGGGINLSNSIWHQDPLSSHQSDAVLLNGMLKKSRRS